MSRRLPSFLPGAALVNRRASQQQQSPSAVGSGGGSSNDASPKSNSKRKRQPVSPKSATKRKLKGLPPPPGSTPSLPSSNVKPPSVGIASLRSSSSSSLSSSSSNSGMIQQRPGLHRFTLFTLPAELVVQVVCHLDLVDIFAVARCNLQLRSMIMYEVPPIVNTLTSDDDDDDVVDNQTKRRRSTTLAKPTNSTSSKGHVPSYRVWNSLRALDVSIPREVLHDRYEAIPLRSSDIRDNAVRTFINKHPWPSVTSLNLYDLIYIDLSRPFDECYDGIMIVVDQQ
jgi:hypothetical protein